MQFVDGLQHLLRRMSYCATGVSKGYLTMRGWLWIVDGLWRLRCGLLRLLCPKRFQKL
jgi:hypothetical protein